MVATPADTLCQFSDSATVSGRAAHRRARRLCGMLSKKTAQGAIDAIEGRVDDHGNRIR
jgi:hypothetical protein